MTKEALKLGLEGRLFQTLEFGTLTDEIIVRTAANPMEGIGHLGDPANMWKAMLRGSDMHAELLINTSGVYTYNCFCGQTSTGNLSELSYTDKYLRCSYLSCGVGVKLSDVFRRYDEKDRLLEAPRIFLIRSPPLDIKSEDITLGKMLRAFRLRS